MLKHRSLPILALAALAGAAHAQAFTPGSLIISQMGDGAAAPTASGSPFALLTAPKAVATPTLVNTFAVNNGTAHTASATSFVANANGDAAKTTRSPNGVLAITPGYSTTIAAGSLTTSTVARRGLFTPFSSTALNSPTFSFQTPTTTGMGGAFSAFTQNGADWWYGSGTGLWYVASGSATAVQVLQTVTSVYNIQGLGGSMFLVTDSGLDRVAGFPTTAASAVRTNISADTEIQDLRIVDGQTAIFGSWQTTGLRRGTIATGNWATTSGPITFSSLDATQASLGNITTDGHRAYSTSYATAPNSVFGYGSVTASSTPVALSTAGANFNYRSVELAPEPSIIGSDYSRTSGVQRFAMRTVGTGTDPFVRSVRVGNMNFASYRTATTLATIPYRGQIVDMCVDNAGNTLMLNVIPNATFTGYLYSIIRVNAAGTLSDEGPLTGGVPSQVAPAGFIPTKISASSGAADAVVLMTNPTSNTARLGLFLLPAIGGGVTTVSDWGPYTAADASHRAVDVFYPGSTNPRILMAGFAAGLGSYQVLATTTSVSSTNFATASGIGGLTGASFVNEPATGDALVLATAGANGRPGFFRLLRSPALSTTPSVTGSLFATDNSVVNSVTGQPLWNQMWPVSLGYDTSLNAPVIGFAGVNGSLVGTSLSAEPRLNIPGSFRAWELTSVGGVSRASYRFFPGINFN